MGDEISYIDSYASVIQSPCRTDNMKFDFQGIVLEFLAMSSR